MIGQFLYQATEPLFRRIRRFMPDLGTIDISPIVVLLGIWLIRLVIAYYIYPYVF
jgi:YggT family protein